MGKSLQKLRLPDAKATLALGKMLGYALTPAQTGICLMLEGDLGAGKTTLTRGLVESLPGGDEAEVASPSFNLVNIYPTQPPVAHFDLYRLEGMPPDELLFEAMDDAEHVLLIEWAQFLDREFWPENYVHLHWTPVDEGREVVFSAAGSMAMAYLQEASKSFDSLR